MPFTTAAINGSKSLMKASTDGATYYNVGEVVEAGIQGQAGTVGADSHDSPSRRQYVPGRSGETVNLTCQYAPGNAGQQLLRAAYLNGTVVYLKALCTNVVGGEKYTHQAVLTSFSHVFPDERAEPLAFGFNITGDITIGTIVSGDL